MIYILLRPTFGSFIFTYLLNHVRHDQAKSKAIIYTSLDLSRLNYYLWVIVSPFPLQKKFISTLQSPADILILGGSLFIEPLDLTR